MAQEACSRRRFLALGAVLGVASAECAEREPDVRVDLARRGEAEPRAAVSTLRFAVGTMLSPRETAREFRQLADYLEARTGRPIELLQRRGYAQTNGLLVRGEADFGFVCTGAYVALGDKVELLVVPVVGGKTTYASQIVVRASDPAQSIAELVSDPFACVDPLSLSGRVYPEWLARQAVGAAGQPFADVVYSHSHTKSIDLVASGRVRGAGVDSLIYERIAKAEPARVESLRVMHRSPDFGIPPFVAGLELDRPTRGLLRRALLKAHAHADGLLALAALGFDRFALGDPKTYSAVAEMQRSVVGVDAGAPEP